MSWFTDFQRAAERTDRLTERPDHVDLLAAGLFGECGSVLAELKKVERETGAYPADLNRLTEEIGDVLWYFARLVGVLDPSEARKFNASEGPGPCLSSADAMTEALNLGGTVGGLIAELQKNEPAHLSASQLGSIWRAIERVASAAGIELSEAGERNLDKIDSRWPANRRFAPLFDDDFDEAEQLPRKLEVEFREIGRGVKNVVLLRCKGLNLGDRLTDNMEHPDFYRFHDVFHFAHAVYLGWSPVLRSLLKSKRKSAPKVDENQDGARAQIIEEAVSAIIFSRAKEIRFYEDIDHVDYDLLKTIRDSVLGFEVEQVRLWQWEEAILNGYRVFRDLKSNGGGIVSLDLINRELSYSAPSRS